MDGLKYARQRIAGQSAAEQDEEVDVHGDDDLESVGQLPLNKHETAAIEDDLTLPKQPLQKTNSMRQKSEAPTYS